MLKLKMHMFFVSYMYIQKKRFYENLQDLKKKYVHVYPTKMQCIGNVHSMFLLCFFFFPV